MSWCRTASSGSSGWSGRSAADWRATRRHKSIHHVFARLHLLSVLGSLLRKYFCLRFFKSLSRGESLFGEVLDAVANGGVLLFVCELSLLIRALLLKLLLLESHLLIVIVGLICGLYRCQDLLADTSLRDKRNLYVRRDRHGSS